MTFISNMEVHSKNTLEKILGENIHVKFRSYCQVYVSYMSMQWFSTGCIYKLLHHTSRIAFVMALFLVYRKCTYLLIVDILLHFTLKGSCRLTIFVTISIRGQVLKKIPHITRIPWGKDSVRNIKKHIK